MGAPLFDEGGQGFQPGLLSELRWSPSSIREAWTTLTNVRRAMVHSTADELVGGAPFQVEELVYSGSHGDLRAMTEFLGALCLSFAIRLLAAIGSRVEAGVEAELAAELRYKLSGELRVLVLRLLQDERFGFAWVMCQAALEVEPPNSKGIMLHLNSFYARQRLGDGYVDSGEIARFDAGPLPRHRLIQAVLLNQTTKNIITPLLASAIESGDVSVAEIDQEWPALRPLRETSWFANFLATQYEQSPGPATATQHRPRRRK